MGKSRSWRRKERKRGISSGLSREWDRDRKRRKERRKRNREANIFVDNYRCLESLQALGKYALWSDRVLCISVRIARQRYRIDSRRKQITLFPTFLPCSEEYSPGEKNWFHFGLDRDKRCNEEYFILEINLKGKGKRSDCWLLCNIG